MHYEPPVLYQIRVKGHLDRRWANRFEGFAITLEGDDATQLIGWVVDQAALHSVLRLIRDLGIPLISLTCIDPKPPKGVDAEP